MTKISGEPAVMWGPSIIGFGTHHYKYETGREGDTGAMGFSPRKANLTIYLMGGTEMFADQLAKLGPHKTAKVCLYVKRLDDLDMAVLKRILTASYRHAMATSVPVG